MDEALTTALGGGVAGLFFLAAYLLIQFCKNRESRCASFCCEMELTNNRRLGEIHRTLTSRQLPEV